VRACLDRARAAGARRVVISARDFVPGPLRLYARMGFVRVPERDWSPAPGVDLIVLRIDLGAPPGLAEVDAPRLPSAHEHQDPRSG
jgi:hypothetical protein